MLKIITIKWKRRAREVRKNGKKVNKRMPLAELRAKDDAWPRPSRPGRMGPGASGWRSSPAVSGLSPRACCSAGCWTTWSSSTSRCSATAALRAASPACGATGARAGRRRHPRRAPGLIGSHPVPWQPQAAPPLRMISRLFLMIPQHASPRLMVPLPLTWLQPSHPRLMKATLPTKWPQPARPRLLGPL